MRKKRRSKLRVLSARENEILNFLWRWKVANIVTIKTFLEPQSGWWRFYKIIQRLSSEKYVQEVSDAKLRGAGWALTKKGFSHIVSGSFELVQRRYSLQSPSHDFWATAFHMGDFVFGFPKNVQIVSEQELCAKHEEVLPSWLPTTREHLSDGYTAILNPLKTVVLAFETELSTKRNADYEKIIHFYDRLESVDLVFWLCADDALIETITRRIFRVNRRRPQIHNFVRFTEFQELGWDAVIVWGSKAKISVSEVLGRNGVNIPANTLSIPHQSDAISVFRCSVKSPRGLPG